MKPIICYTQRHTTHRLSNNKMWKNARCVQVQTAGNWHVVYLFAQVFYTSLEFYWYTRSILYFIVSYLFATAFHCRRIFINSGANACTSEYFNFTVWDSFIDRSIRSSKRVKPRQLQTKFGAERQTNKTR